MRETYRNENTISIHDIPLSATNGIKLNVVWKQKKETYYVVKPWSEKNIIGELAQRQYHLTLQNGNR